MAEEYLKKPLDGAGLAVVNSILQSRLDKKANKDEIIKNTNGLINDAGFITLADVPDGVAASNTVPKMDGDATAGEEAAFARGDHVHPTDTTRLATNGDGSQVTVSFNTAVERSGITSGDSLSVALGKIAKYLADLHSLAYKDTVELADLAEAIQTSLSKADSALQSYTETDPTVPSWAKEATKPTYTAVEVGAISSDMLDSLALKSDLVNVYRYKGSVALFRDLPKADQTAGDVYNVEETDMNYAWDGSKWDPLGNMFQLECLSDEDVRTIMGD